MEVRQNKNWTVKSKRIEFNLLSFTSILANCITNTITAPVPVVTRWLMKCLTRCTASLALSLGNHAKCQLSWYQFDSFSYLFDALYNTWVANKCTERLWIVGSRRRLKIYFKKSQNLGPAWGLRANLDNFFDKRDSNRNSKDMEYRRTNCPLLRGTMSKRPKGSMTWM